MENYGIILFVLGVMIALCALADKWKIPSSILLIIVGIAIGFIPDLPKLELNPDIILLLFLPPLLFDGAFNINPVEFKNNFNTISTLAVSLVFITALGIGVIVHYMVPNMPWALSFVLGSILSATDAVAAMNITKDLGLSHKASTILEGESLVNDASSLVAYRFAVAAVTGVAFHFVNAGLQFIYLMGGGFFIGWLMQELLELILKRIKENSVITISFILLAPFVTYLIAEELHVSGVIAVVILGVGILRLSRKTFPEKLKNQSKSIWEIIVFLLNGLIFILMGLQFPYILKTMDKAQIVPNIFYAFIITVAALALRMARVFLQRIHLERVFQKQDTKRRKRITEDSLLDVKTCLIISWAGMRGIVSLAIAIALPFTMDNGKEFPQRSTIVFISIVVVLFTLLGQGLTLPGLIKRLKEKEN